VENVSARSVSLVTALQCNGRETKVFLMNGRQGLIYGAGRKAGIDCKTLLDPLTIKHAVDFRSHGLFKQWTFTTKLTTLLMKVLHS